MLTGFELYPRWVPLNKRSPLELQEEPNAQESPPHRYLTFTNHTK